MFAMNLIIEDNRVALRFLQALNSTKDLVERNSAELLTTEKIAQPFIAENKVLSYYPVAGKATYIFAECIFDKTDEEFANMLYPGVHLMFHQSPTRGLVIDPKGALTYFTRRNSAQLCRYDGGGFYFDLWVRNINDPITEWSRSLTISPKLKLITNIKDLGELWDADVVMRGGSSKWLNLAYRLIPQKETIAPNEKVRFMFEVLDGKTYERATDVTWDGWIVEPVDGYVPHRRIDVKNGIGSFDAYALYLNKGDSMRVKVRNRFQTSIAESVIQIV